MKEINRYTIHEDWWKIADISLLREFERSELISIEGKTISFTVNGEEKIKGVLKEKPIPVGEILNQVYVNAEIILNTLIVESRKC